MSDLLVEFPEAFGEEETDLSLEFPETLDEDETNLILEFPHTFAEGTEAIATPISVTTTQNAVSGDVSTSESGVATPLSASSETTTPSSTATTSPSSTPVASASSPTTPEVSSEAAGSSTSITATSSQTTGSVTTTATPGSTPVAGVASTTTPGGFRGVASSSSPISATASPTPATSTTTASPEGSSIATASSTTPARVSSNATGSSTTISATSTQPTATTIVGLVGSGSITASTSNLVESTGTSFTSVAGTPLTETTSTTTPSVVRTGTTPESDYRYLRTAFPDRLIKFDAQGQTEWEESLPFTPSEIATDADRDVYLTGNQGTIASYDQNGNERWRKDAYFDRTHDLSVTEKGELFVFADDELVYKFDTDTGAELYQSDLIPESESLAGIEASPDGRVFITRGSSDGSSFIELDDTGSVVYDLDLNRGSTAPPAVEDDRYVSVVDGNYLVRIDTETQSFVEESGEKVEQQLFAGASWDLTIDGDGGIYASGDLNATGGDNGILKFSWDTGVEWTDDVNYYQGNHARNLDVTNDGVLYSSDDTATVRGESDHQFVARDVETGSILYESDLDDNEVDIAAFPDYSGNRGVWEGHTEASLQAASTSVATMSSVPTTVTSAVSGATAVTATAVPYSRSPTSRATPGIETLTTISAVTNPAAESAATLTSTVTTASSSMGSPSGVKRMIATGAPVSAHTTLSVGILREDVIHGNPITISGSPTQVAGDGFAGATAPAFGATATTGKSSAVTASDGSAIPTTVTTVFNLAQAGRFVDGFGTGVTSSGAVSTPDVSALATPMTTSTPTGVSLPQPPSVTTETSVTGAVVDATTSPTLGVGTRRRSVATTKYSTSASLNTAFVFTPRVSRLTTETNQMSLEDGANYVGIGGAGSNQAVLESDANRLRVDGTNTNEVTVRVGRDDE